MHSCHGLPPIYLSFDECLPDRQPIWPCIDRYNTTGRPQIVKRAPEVTPWQMWLPQHRFQSNCAACATHGRPITEYSTDHRVYPSTTSVRHIHRRPKLRLERRAGRIGSRRRPQLRRLSKWSLPRYTLSPSQNHQRLLETHTQLGDGIIRQQD
eukprot:COSAG02_NODE_932_length_15816_cov_15.913088_3_plen_153_part_00